jgi:hypothetical protein
MEDVGIFYAHLVFLRLFDIVYGHLVYLWLFGIYFSHLGMLYQEKSGNPCLHICEPSATSKLCFECAFFPAV